MAITLSGLEAELAGIAAFGFAVDPVELVRSTLEHLTPPERISTTECAATTRYVGTGTAGVKRLWSPDLTPYVVGIQDALDHRAYTTVIVPGSARSGKTMAAENHLHKRMRIGPMTDALWFLPGESDVESYVDKDFASYFEMHPEVAAKIGKGKSDNKRKLKRVNGRFIQILPANGNSVRAKQAPFIVADEIDGFRPSLRNNMKQQLDIRGRTYGKARKAYLCSHPDAGWNGGISAHWKESTRGTWWWACPHCGDWSSPCPTAEWRTKLSYTRDKTLPKDEMLAKVAETAGLLCPHCGTLITNEHKFAMNLAGKWVFEGQIIAPDGTVSGAVVANDTAGFWIHGTMSPFVTWGELAGEYVAALVFFEESGKTDRLREVTAKSLGEPYEGPDGKRIDVALLKKRAVDEADTRHPVGTCPAWTRYVTKTADIAGDGFDILVQAWGADGESAIVDRYKRVSAPDGRKLAPPKRLADWDLLREELQKRYPIWPKMTHDLPVSSLGIDTGGAPGTTANAYAWARQMYAGPCRGDAAYRLRLFKGASNKKAPELPVSPTFIERDDAGQKIEPPVPLLVIGVHELKKVVADRMTIDAPGPGFIHFPAGADSRWVEEMTNERLVDDDWVRHGDNETFDCLVMAEAVRQLLRPDRDTIDWKKRSPSWGRAEPIPAADAPRDPAAARRERNERLLRKMTANG